MSGWVQFDNDFNSFTQGSTDHTTAQGQYGTDQTDYKAKYNAFEAKIKGMDPFEAMVLLMNMLATSTTPENHANILGLYDDQTNVVGKSMAVNARNSQLANDIQNLTTDSVDQSVIPPAQQVAVASKAISEMINAFQNNQDVINSFDPSVITPILTQLQSIQSTINTYFSTTVPQPAGTYPSFDAMKQALNNKDPGNAAKAAKAFSDASQILTSETQNINAATNQTVSQITGMDKNWQSFFGALMKDLIDQVTAIIQNLGKG